MNNSLRSIEEYELFVYTLASFFRSIQSSTLTIVREGASLARVKGEIFFVNEFRLVLREWINYSRARVTIRRYGYEVWRGDEKLFWYDSQPHPDDPKLRENHPHHKHLPPDIKHNRVPAPEMSFTQPNLPVLIREIETLITQQARDEETEQKS